MPQALLAPMPYADWEKTKTTLHLWCQIVGKIKLRYSAHRNHWWNVALRPTARGPTTGLMAAGDTYFEFEFDFIEHRLVLRSNRERAASGFALEDGLSVAEFYRNVLASLADIGIEARIVAKPYGVPMNVPFPDDREHRSYDATAVHRWFDALLWTTSVFETFAGEFSGKQSPVQIFWHTLDLAMGRYSGRLAGGAPRDDVVQQEAYSHEVIAFGFWAGDANVPAPTFYTYTAPEPGDLTEHTLAPPQAGWFPSGAGHIGALPYDVVRESPDPRATLLAFLAAGYEAGTRTAHWDASSLASTFPG